MPGNIGVGDVGNCQNWIEATHPIPSGGRRELVVTREWGGTTYGGNGLGQQLINSSQGGNLSRVHLINRTRETVQVDVNNPNAMQLPGGLAGMALIYEVNLGFYKINGDRFIREGDWARYRYEVSGARASYTFDCDLTCNDWNDATVELACQLAVQQMYLLGVFVRAGNGSLYAMNDGTECMYPTRTDTFRQSMNEASQCVPLTPGVRRVSAFEETFDSGGNLVRTGVRRDYTLTCDAYRSIQ